MEALGVEELAEIYQAQKNVEAVLTTDHEVLQCFIDPGRGFIKRGVQGRGGDNNDNATCTAFCLYYLAGVNLLGRVGERVFSPLRDEEAGSALRALGNALTKGHSPRRGKTRTGVAHTATGLLPNQYNSAIQLAGFLRAARGLEYKVSADSLRACGEIADYLSRLVIENGGWVPRIGPKADVASVYLTFWAGAALHEWIASVPKSKSKKAREAVRLIGDWSERELANSIACHHSGITSDFDIIELIYAALSALQFQDTAETRKLAAHGLTILFDDYFRDGCFKRSAPVLADQRNFSLQCPTAEALALVLMTDPRLLVAHWRSLRAVFDWLTKHKCQGWYPEAEGRHGVATAFMTVSALVFLERLTVLLDTQLADGASQELDVPPYLPNPKLDKIPYPASLRTLLRSSVVEPLSRREHGQLACYSMILYGPPGTSKTTIAQKLAQELRWPLLVLHQSDFLKNGVDRIDVEADRIFRLASYLKNVVVLFDEVEELVRARRSPLVQHVASGEDFRPETFSRLLTTSMLPRIHHLRDQKRVVFILSTNHREALDPAICRQGRFDIVRGVWPPTKSERKSMLTDILKEFDAVDELESLFEEASIVKLSDRFGFLDLKALVRTILAKVRVERKPATKMLVEDVFEKAKKTVLNETELKGYKRMKELDHP